MFSGCWDLEVSVRGVITACGAGPHLCSAAFCHQGATSARAGPGPGREARGEDLAQAGARRGLGQKRALWPCGGREVSTPSLQTPLDATGNTPLSYSQRPSSGSRRHRRLGIPGPGPMGGGAPEGGEERGSAAARGAGLVPRRPRQQRLARMPWVFSPAAEALFCKARL